MAAPGRLLGVAAGALAAVRRRPRDYYAVSAAAVLLSRPGVETLTHAELPVSQRFGQRFCLHFGRLPQETAHSSKQH